MYNSCFDNIFIGKYITYLPSCHSTNAIASEFVQNGQINDGDVVITDFQSAGRGQRGSGWESEAGKNLLLSVYLKPDFLQISNQFLLSMAISVSVRDFLEKYTKDVKIKWPNDIYIRDRKCAGILIENVIAGSNIRHSIAGTGININQLEFGHPRATSLAAETHSVYNLRDIFPELLASVEKYYLMIKKGQTSALKKAYTDALYGKNETRQFRDNHGTFEGSVEGVNDQGMLIMNKAGRQPSYYGMKEIEWLW